MPSTEEYRSELQDIAEQLGTSEVTKNPDKLAELSRRHAFLSQLVSTEDQIAELNRRILENEQLLAEESSEEMRAMAREEQNELHQELETKQQERKELLTPKKEIPREIMVEIRAGAGGEEAGLFAWELWQAYLSFLQEQGVNVSVITLSMSDAGGLKEGTFEAQGTAAYESLQYESGVHRVQRVPETEKSGRTHTSTVTVAVLPVPKDVDMNINENEIEMETFRSSGPGGQSVNTTDSAVRLTHIPTGTVVACQDEKSQLKNRQKADKLLRTKIYEAQLAAEKAEESAQRRSQIGSGDRSEKIRTYNFPQDRITDHRIGRNFPNVERVMSGVFSPIVNALDEYYQEHPE